MSEIKEKKIRLKKQEQPSKDQTQEVPHVQQEVPVKQEVPPVEKKVKKTKSKSSQQVNQQVDQKQEGQPQEQTVPGPVKGSKTTVNNIDLIISTLITKFNLPEKEVKMSIENLLPTSSTYVKKHKKRDPNAPKKALTPYLFFTQENRDKIVKENPGIKFNDIGRKLGEKWKTLSDQEKQPYMEKAQADKVRLNNEKMKVEV